MHFEIHQLVPVKALFYAMVYPVKSCLEILDNSCMLLFPLICTGLLRHAKAHLKVAHVS